jgi:hypothetical protein
MAGATRIRTPDKVRRLQITLYRKAKADPKYRFWSLYGELLRPDVLNAALAAQLPESVRKSLHIPQLCGNNESCETLFFDKTRLEFPVSEFPSANQAFPHSAFPGWPAMSEAPKAESNGEKHEKTHKNTQITPTFFFTRPRMPPKIAEIAFQKL